MQSELKKMKASRASEGDEMHNSVASEETLMEVLFPNQPAETADRTQRSPGPGTKGYYGSCINSSLPTIQGDEPLANVVSPASRSGELSESTHEPISNPLALLADASDAAQAMELHSMSNKSSPETNGAFSVNQPLAGQSTGASLGRQLLQRPGYVSLGLELDRDTLEAGINTLIGPSESLYHYSNYFKSTPQVPLRDIGPDVDPVDLGLVTMDEACYLFPM